MPLKCNRRRFLEASAATLAGVPGLTPLPADEGRPKLRLGMFVGVGKDVEPAIRQVHDLGFSGCEVYTDEVDLESADRLRAALERYRVVASAVSSLGPGPMVWDFYQGPVTIGVVPRQWRRQRVDHFKRASDYAKRADIPAFDTHCGFIPENPNDPLYKETIEALKEVVSYCRSNEQTFLYHAGQETPVTLLRAIEDVGLENQGVCLDTANPIMYDTGHPVDALDVYAKYLRAVNPKDALYPTNPKDLGKEVPIGEGKVGFPRFIRRLKELGYSGPLNIEREISGPQQIADIKKARAYLERLIG
jgi:sugar phosphate isomerase/epimerase